MARAVLDLGPAGSRRRVSPPPWQVAFVLDFAGQGRSRLVTTVPQKGAERGGRGVRSCPGRRAEEPGAGGEPPAAEKEPPADLGLTSLAPAPGAVLRAPAIPSRQLQGTPCHLPHPVSHGRGHSCLVEESLHRLFGLNCRLPLLGEQERRELARNRGHCFLLKSASKKDSSQGFEL